MEKLQWFKFSYADWRMGKIQKCDEITQARFINLCCLYWSKDGLLTFEDAEIEIETEHLEALIKRKIIKVKDEFIKIEFLDEQIENISETSEKRRDAVLKRWDKVKENNTKVKQNNTSVLQNDTEESRVDKSREEKKRKDNIKSEFFKETSAMDLIQKQWSITDKRFKELKDLFWALHYEDAEIIKNINQIRGHFNNWLKYQDKTAVKKKYEKKNHLGTFIVELTDEELEANSKGDAKYRLIG